jgi:hypothetical protein
MKSSVCRPAPALWLAGYQIASHHCHICKRPLHPDTTAPIPHAGPELRPPRRAFGGGEPFTGRR